MRKGTIKMAQTDGFHDLYRILQVHHLAEPEVIEGAYKRLSRKYHPDANRDSGSGERMKLINYAYSVLSNPEKRNEYDLDFQRRLEAKERFASRQTLKKEELLVERAIQVVKNYFAALAKYDFDLAFGLLSNEDKKYIDKKEFWEWQKAVADLYEIGEYQCVHFKTVSGRDTGNKPFTFIFEFQVHLVERERATGELHQVEFPRMVVQEKNDLKMYLGNKDIRSIIDKLRQIAVEQLVSEENGYDKTRIHLEIEREITRAVRYARPFSVLLLEAINFRQTEDVFNPDVCEASFTAVLREVNQKLRATDYGGRWSRNRIMVVLPETRIFAATKVVEKLFNVIRVIEEPEDKAGQLIFCAGLAQYKQGCLQEFIDLIVSNVLAAHNRGEWRIVF
jgi:diguanylate cyclase (GGDEF)-like protein